MAPINLKAQPDYDLNDPPKRISLDAFYEELTAFSLTDEQALEYMQFSSKLAMVSFKDDAEMLSFKADFTAALAFIGKLDDVDTKGVEPLGNVLEYYGGNDEKLRTMEDFNKAQNELVNAGKKSDFLRMNKHARKDGNYSVVPSCTQPNPDGED